MPKKSPEAPLRRSASPAPDWQFFFARQRSPILRSQLITALLTGTVLEVDRLPKALLLDAVLLSLATRVYHNSEIVDDYSKLLRRTDETWRDPSGLVVYSIKRTWASRISSCAVRIGFGVWKNATFPSWRAGTSKTACRFIMYAK